MRLDLADRRAARTELNDPTTFNAQTPPFMTSLALCVAVVRRLCVFADLSAHVLEGVGAHFCTGGRHDDHRGAGSAPAALAGLRGHSSITLEIRSSLVPTSAAVHGKVIGGGVALALAADWRACPETATFNFGNLPRGVNPILMFSRALPLMVGRHSAFQMYVEDVVVPSRELRAYGLVNEIVADVCEAKRAALERGSLGRGAVARVCASDSAHAAREVIYFVESSAERPRFEKTPGPSSRARKQVAPRPPPTTATLRRRSPTFDDSAILSRVFEVLGTRATSETPLMTAGIDSLGATELQKTLGADLSLDLPATLLFDHPSVAAIVEFVESMALDTGYEEVPLQGIQGSPEASSTVSVTLSRVIAKLAGDVGTLPRLREITAIVGATSATVPADRWRVDNPPSATYGSFLVDGLRVDS